MLTALGDTLPAALGLTFFVLLSAQPTRPWDRPGTNHLG